MSKSQRNIVIATGKDMGKRVPLVDPVELQQVNVALTPPVATPEEVKAITRELNKDAQLHNAVLLCLNLLLTQARYGRIQREADVEIVAAIASLE